MAFYLAASDEDRVRMTHEIISLAEAKSQGLKHYFTGKPCKRGHFSQRLVGNRSCCECLVEHMRDWRNTNRDTERERQRNSYHKNREILIPKMKTWREANPEKMSQSSRNWRLANPQHTAALNAKRRAAKLQRTPQWADLEAIKAVYLACPEGMTVDHEIPLQGEFVSGLHVENNLRYLTPSANSSKGNSFQAQF